MHEPSEAERLEQMGTRLGYLGLIPFVAGAITALVSEELANVALQAFILYSLGILSFMGGIHWGLALGYGYTSEHASFDFCDPSLDCVGMPHGIAGSVCDRRDRWHVYRSVVCRPSDFR